MKKKEDLRIRKTKANLYKGLFKIMEEKSFEEIKVTDICKVSNINRSTFYDHFNDKYELLQTLIKDMQEETQEQYKVSSKANTVKEHIIENARLLIEYIKKNITLYSALSVIKNNNNSIAYDMLFNSFLKESTQTFQNRFINHSNVPIETISIFYVTGTIKVIADAIKDIDNFKEEVILEHLNLLLPEIDYLEPIKKEEN